MASTATTSTLREERARARERLREERNAAASAPAPALPPVRTPATNPHAMVDLTGWQLVPASQAAQFYTERGKLVTQLPTPSPSSN